MKARKAYRSKRAAADLLDIFTYIGEDNLEKAKSFLRTVNSDLKNLLATPGIGSLRDFKDPLLKNVRSSSVSGFRKYLIFL